MNHVSTCILAFFTLCFVSAMAFQYGYTLRGDRIYGAMVGKLTTVTVMQEDKKK